MSCEEVQSSKQDVNQGKSSIHSLNQSQSSQVSQQTTEKGTTETKGEVISVESPQKTMETNPKEQSDGLNCQEDEKQGREWDSGFEKVSTPKT